MDEKQIEKMLNAAAAKLGMSPEQLKSAAMAGDVNGILSHLDEKSADKVRNAMSNKNISNDILNQINNKD